MSIANIPAPTYPLSSLATSVIATRSNPRRLGPHMLPLRFTRSVQNLQRLQHIARVLTQHGFGHVVDQVDLGRFVPLRLRRKPAATKEEAPYVGVGRRMTRVASELGPIFVKLGQMLATRPDILPPEILTELQTLQDQVQPFDSSLARQIIETELKMPVDDAYANVESDPIASGSIGQVYRAALHDGRHVVIKVRRPDIERDIRADLQILKWFAEALERWVAEARPFHPLSLVEEFERTLLRELDFMHEAATTARLRDAFQDDPNVEIPAVIWSHSTPGMLTLEALDGESLNAVLDTQGPPFHRKALAARLADMYLKQFFEIGTFHADPHPGNILVTAPERIGLIDFGQTGVISDEMAGDLVVLLLGVVTRDMNIIADALIEMGAISTKTERRQLVTDLQYLVDKYHSQPLQRLKIQSVFTEAAEVIRHHDATIPRDVVLMLKSLTTVWGVAVQLDPDLDIVGLLKPRLLAMIRARLSPMKMLRAGGLTMWHVLSFLRTAPQQIREMLQKASSGGWQINVRHDNLEPLARDIDRSSNRLAFSIVIAGLIVGSSMVVSADPQIHVFGIQLQSLGVAGYLVAAVLGMGLIWAIFRSGRLS